MMLSERHSIRWRNFELPYPGGPQIEKLAQKGNPLRHPFKGGQVKGNLCNLSFSGLKTAVLYTLYGQNGAKKTPLNINEEERADIAASFQYTACFYLVEKILFAAQQMGARSIILGGGVSQNKYLRQFLESRVPLPVFWPPAGLSLDNGAMIAGLGLHRFLRDGPDSMNLEALTRIQL